MHTPVKKIPFILTSKPASGKGGESATLQSGLFFLETKRRKGE